MIKKLFLFLLLPLITLFSADGLNYTCLYQGYQVIRVLEVDPSHYEIRPIRALDNGIGRESVLSMSKRYGALASINGGFFTIGGTWDGLCCGALKIGEWVALPTKPRGCIGWSSLNPYPKMDRLLVSVEGHYEENSFRIELFNKPRKQSEMVLFNSSFHRTTLTPPDGEEILIVNGRIDAIRKAGSSKIPEGGYVLSIGRNHPLFNTFEVGKPLTFTFHIEPQIAVTHPSDWHSLDYVVGGTPLLLYNHIKITDFSQEQTRSVFLTQRYARSAIGILPSGHWLFVVVDKIGLFDGMTIEELADLMSQLGCSHALNLDGGGSSTLYYEGKIVNSTYGDEYEDQNVQKIRRVSDAILVLPKGETS